MAALARLGRWLGAGLKGGSVRPRSPVARAYATAVLAAVPDDIARDAQRSWAGTAVELSRWTEAGVLADLAGTGGRTGARLVGHRRPYALIVPRRCDGPDQQ